MRTHPHRLLRGADPAFVVGIFMCCNRLPLQLFGYALVNQEAAQARFAASPSQAGKFACFRFGVVGWSLPSPLPSTMCCQIVILAWLIKPIDKCNRAFI
jgi:hypothetical protein